MTLIRGLLPPGLRVAVRRPSVTAAISLGILGLLLFGPALWNGFTAWDDDVYVTRNPLIQELSLPAIARVFTTFSNCNYHPLTYLTYMVEHALVGLDPWLYHLDNVLLHIASSILAFFLARRWSGSAAAAFLAALLFLIHPLRAESVAWVAERKDVLCAAFYLAALLAYPLDRGKGPSIRYLLSLSLFTLALLSKAMAITLPAVLLVLHFLERRPLRPILPFLILGILFSGLAFAAQDAYGAVSSLHGGGIAAHLLTVPKALAFYAGKLALPVLLSPRYIIQPAGRLLQPQVLAGIALISLGIWVSAASLRRRRIAFLGLSFFLLTWAPVSGIVPTSTIAADRYLYLPALGLFLAISAGTAEGLKRASGAGAVLGRSGLAVLGILIAASLYLTPCQVLRWRDGISLWESALRENPENPFAQNQLSLAYHASGRYAESAAAAKEAARLGFREPRWIFNLCLAYRELGDREKELESAREILKGSPDFIPAWIVVARHLRESGKLAEGEGLLEGLLLKFPDDPGLLGARGDLEAARGSFDAALALYLRSLELRPGDPEVRLGAAAALASLGMEGKALDLAEGTLKMPGGAVHPSIRERVDGLAAVLEKRGSGDLARRAREAAKVSVNFR